MNTTFDAVRAEALFASAMQASQAPSSVQIRAAVTMTLRRFGVNGCIAKVATEFGDHPDMAPARMGWALDMIHSAYRELAANEFAYAG